MQATNSGSFYNNFLFCNGAVSVLKTIFVFWLFTEYCIKKGAVSLVVSHRK